MKVGPTANLSIYSSEPKIFHSGRNLLPKLRMSWHSPSLSDVLPQTRVPRLMTEPCSGNE